MYFLKTSTKYFKPNLNYELNKTHKSNLALRTNRTHVHIIKLAQEHTHRVDSDCL